MTCYRVTFNIMCAFGPDVLTQRLNTEYTGLFEMIVGVLTTCHTQNI